MSALTQITTGNTKKVASDDNQLEPMPIVSASGGRDWKILNSCSSFIKNNPGLVKMGVILLMFGTVAACSCQDVITLICNSAHKEDSYGDHETVSVFPYLSYSLARTDENENLYQYIIESLLKSNNRPATSCDFALQLTAYKGNLSSVDYPNMTFPITAAAALLGDKVVIVAMMITSIAVVVFGA